MIRLSKHSKYSMNPIEETNAAVRKMELAGKQIAKLNIGDPTRYFPTPKYIIDAYVRALKEGKTSYTTAGGLPELRDAVAKEYGSGTSADDVIITNGVSESLLILNSIMIDEGDAALVMRPYYSMYNSFLQIMGGTPIDMNLDEHKGWGLDLDGLEKAAKSAKGRAKYLIFANPNNPTGTVLGRKDLSALVGIANEHDMLLVCDEIYDHMVFNGARFTSIADVAKGTPHVILNGASKGLASTGFRIGYAVIPEHDSASNAVREKFVEYTTLRLSANTPAEYAVLEGLTNKNERDRATSRMVREIAERCNYATDLINKSEYMEVVRPNGAFYLFPKVRMDMLDIKDDKEFVDSFLNEDLVLLSRGSGFGAGSHVRMVGLPEKGILGSAIAKLDSFCERHRKR